MSEQTKCPCMAGGTAAEKLPVPVAATDLPTPLYQACGGRLYRLHIQSLARYILMSDGVSVEERINTVERAQAANTTLRFADNIAGRDALAGLVPGDQCYVSDARPEAKSGGAMFLWLPALKWRKLWEGDSPLDCENVIVPGGGLGMNEKGDRLKVICKDLLHDGGGLALCENGKILVRAEDLFAEGGGLAVDKDGHLKVSLADLLAEGGGLKLDARGNLLIDLSGMSEDSIRKLLANLLREGNGLKLDEDGRIVFDPEELPPSAINISSVSLSEITNEQKKILSKAIAAELIHPKGGLGVHPDDKLLYVDFERMDSQIMKDVVLGMIRDRGGLAVDGAGKLYVDFNNLDDTGKADLLQAIRVPMWMTGNKTFYVDKDHPDRGDMVPVPVWDRKEPYEAFEQRRNAAQELNKKRGTAAYPFDSIQHALDHVCANFNVDKYTATIRVAAGTYHEDVTLPNFSYTTGRVAIQGAGSISFTEAGAITDSLDTIFTGRFMDAGGGIFLITGMRLRPAPRSGEDPIWTAESVYPVRISGRGTQLYLQNCRVDPPAAMPAGKSAYALWLTGGNATIAASCVFGGAWNSLWFCQMGSSLTLSRDTLLDNVSAETALLSLSNSSFLRAGVSNSDLALILTKGTAITCPSYYATLNSVLSLRGAPNLIPGAAGELLSGSQAV